MGLCLELEDGDEAALCVAVELDTAQLNGGGSRRVRSSVIF